MRISSKGRYGLATMVYMATRYKSGEYITILSVSQQLNISKIYLEQIFSQLKKANIISSVKGPGGGYLLSKSPEAISAYEILSATEQGIFEKAEETVKEGALAIEMTMQNVVFSKLDDKIKEFLENISLSELAASCETYQNKDNYMFYL